MMYVLALLAFLVLAACEQTSENVEAQKNTSALALSASERDQILQSPVLKANASAGAQRLELSNITDILVPNASGHLPKISVPSRTSLHMPSFDTLPKSKSSGRRRRSRRRRRNDDSGGVGDGEADENDCSQRKMFGPGCDDGPPAKKPKPNDGNPSGGGVARTTRSPSSGGGVARTTESPSSGGGVARTTESPSSATNPSGDGGTGNAAAARFQSNSGEFSEKHVAQRKDVAEFISSERFEETQNNKQPPEKNSVLVADQESQARFFSQVHSKAMHQLKTKPVEKMLADEEKRRKIAKDKRPPQQPRNDGKTEKVWVRGSDVGARIFTWNRPKDGALQPPVEYRLGLVIVDYSRHSDQTITIQGEEYYSDIIVEKIYHLHQAKDPVDPTPAPDSFKAFEQLMPVILP